MLKPEHCIGYKAALSTKRDPILPIKKISLLKKKYLFYSIKNN